MTPRHVLAISALALAVAGGLSWGAQADPGMGGVVQATPGSGKIGITVPQAKLVKAVEGWRAARAEVRALRYQYRQAQRLVGLINHPTPAGNREVARRYFGAEFSCAAVIINGETGGTWRTDVAYGFRYGAHLIYSGLAYGLGQARPGTKMLAFGGDAATNPLTQLVWFRAYAEGRYGSVCAAAAHWTPRRSW